MSSTSEHHRHDPANGAYPPSPQRDFPAPANRVLIIGLDGVTWTLLKPLMDEGRMPRLAEAVAAGTSGVLQSTTPPITPAAWTTFLTGLQPGSHGIIDFERYDVQTNKLSFNTTGCLQHVRSIWQILGEKGFRIGSVNIPMTYPPVPVNGFLVSGFETPGADADFVYPPDIKDELLSRWPDPTLGTNWRRRTFGGDKLFADNIDYMIRSFHQGADMTMFLGRRFGWNALMVVFKLTDNLQHKAWKYLDPRWSDRNPVRRDLAKRGFEEADRAVGTLLDYAARHGAVVVMVSDHGHGSLEGKVQPNLFLKNWGYLTLHGGGAQKATRSKYVWDRFRGRTGKFQRVGDIAQDLAVDFDQTKACIMHAGMAGFLYINLKGRQPTGIVHPQEYESLRDELVARFLGPGCRALDPSGREVQLFSAAHKPEQLYGCTRERQPWMPDLILIPHESLAVIRKIRGRRPVRWLPYRKLEGTHRPEGIFVVSGPGIAQRSNVDAHIVDCAPTILSLLGLRIPAEMEGRVIDEIFVQRPKIEIEPAPHDSCPPSAQGTTENATIIPAGAGDEAAGYSEAELRRVTERLSDLGYLE